ncbi:DUF6141 family protein [Halorussus salilacus]|uniref:DUF6141 family protein n=1 Tax=Halorussus salilacus TaxID=2953750 RepID=UPI0020A1742F|nr:DUF6141 family protein [Halorussus salilacus]USZ68211.1 DUF6141 family protein [Halorussus salilacus]
METEVLFRETQTYRQPWLWGLLALRPALTLVGLARGTRTRADAARELASFLGVALLLGTTRLTTEVRDDGVYLKFEPFHRSFRRIPLEDIEEFEAAGYSPLRYGGWGFRWTPSSVAYTVSGRSGVVFDRTNGRSVYVGSDRPDELLAAVQEATNRTV